MAEAKQNCTNVEREDEGGGKNVSNVEREVEDGEKTVAEDG